MENKPGMIWKTEIPIRTMIIPAAGYGTRMREITRGRSKEIVYVGSQPAIMYALQEAIWAGLTSPCGLVPIEEGLYKITPEIPTEFPCGLRTTGIYAASVAFLDTCRELLKKSTRIKEIKDRDVRNRMAEKDQYTLGLDLGANVLDIGNPQGYKLAQVIFSKQGYGKQRG